MTRDELVLLLGGLLLIVAGASMTGCDGAPCGPGTVRAGDTCIPGLGPACGYGTREEAGACVPDPTVPELKCGAGSRDDNGTCVSSLLTITGTGARARGVTFTAPAGLDALVGSRVSQDLVSGVHLLTFGQVRLGSQPPLLFGGAATAGLDQALVIDRLHGFSGIGVLDGETPTLSGVIFELPAFADDTFLKLEGATVAVTEAGPAGMAVVPKTVTVSGRLTLANAALVPAPDGMGTFADYLDAHGIAATAGGWDVAATLALDPAYVF